MTLERANLKIQELLDRPSCWVRQLVSLLGLLTATEKENNVHINYLKLKAVFLALKEFQDLCSDKVVLIYSNRQHHICCLHKQGKRHEVRPYVCPNMENPDLVLQETGNLHSWVAECGSRQAIQAGPDNSDRMVSSSTRPSFDIHQVAPTSTTPFRNEVQQQVSPFLCHRFQTP